MKLELPSHDGAPVLNLAGVTVASLGVPIPFTEGVWTSIAVPLGAADVNVNVVPLTEYSLWCWYTPSQYTCT